MDGVQIIIRAATMLKTFYILIWVHIIFGPLLRQGLGAHRQRLVMQYLLFALKVGTYPSKLNFRGSIIGTVLASAYEALRQILHLLVLGVMLVPGGKIRAAITGPVRQRQMLPPLSY